MPSRIATMPGPAASTAAGHPVGHAVADQLGAVRHDDRAGHDHVPGPPALVAQLDRAEGVGEEGQAERDRDEREQRDRAVERAGQRVFRAPGVASGDRQRRKHDQQRPHAGHRAEHEDRAGREHERAEAGHQVAGAGSPARPRVSTTAPDAVISAPGMSTNRAHHRKSPLACAEAVTTALASMATPREASHRTAEAFGVDEACGYVVTFPLCPAGSAGTIRLALPSQPYRAARSRRRRSRRHRSHRRRPP